MKDKKAGQKALTADETRIIEGLRRNPLIMERVRSILDLAQNAEGPLKTADQIEELLIEEIRKLGSATMHEWAAQAEQRVTEELQKDDPSLLSRKKKTLRWSCVFGTISVRDRIWRSATQRYVRPLPQRLGVAPMGKSRRLQRVLVDFGCEESFAKAAGRVREHYGIDIGATAVRLATLAHAQRAKVQLEVIYEQPFRLLPACGAQHVIAQADGTMICTVAPGRRSGLRPREWKEIKLVAAQAKGSATPVYGVTFGSVEQAGRRWGHCAREAGWGLDSHVQAMGDGAEWIRLQAKNVFGQQGSYLCDFYHVSEYLAAAALSCRPQNPHQWRRTQQQRLRRGAVEKVLDAMSGNLEPAGTPEEDAPVQNGYRYLNNRRDCLDYPKALELGLPIGSGMIESGHRHVLQARLKKAGAAWLQATADQLSQLRVLRANQLWNSFWN